MVHVCDISTADVSRLMPSHKMSHSSSFSTLTQIPWERLSRIYCMGMIDTYTIEIISQRNLDLGPVPIVSILKLVDIPYRILQLKIGYVPFAI